jgi:hypothetical protein
MARIQSAATVGRGTPILNVAGSRTTTNNLVLDGIDANSFGSNSLITPLTQKVTSSLSG